MVAVLLAGLVVCSAATGHSQNNYYPRIWKQDVAAQFKFVSNFPSGGLRTRVEDGAHEWNDLSPNMRFYRQTGADYGQFKDNVCPNQRPHQKDGVHWKAIDGAGNIFGRAYTCTFPGTNRLKNFQIRFDRATTWYAGTGTPPAGAVDMWSGAAHEFGHATGFHGPYAKGHFNPRGSVCTDAPRHTMCPIIPAGNGGRSLEEHDRHTFRNAY